MEKKVFSLDIRENDRFTRIVQVIFGSACVIIACFWLIFNMNSSEFIGATWVTIVFLTGFGIYQIYSGLGFARRFIEIDSEKIRLRRNPVGRTIELLPAGIENIDSYPLNLTFFLKSSGKIRLRFGTTYPEKIELIKDSVSSFAALHKIRFDIKVEGL